MKSTLFFLVAVFAFSMAPCKSYANGDALKNENQTDCWEPDTVYFYHTNTSITNSRFISKYNSQGLLTININQLQGIDSWENASLVTYTYDSNNNLLIKLAQKWENDSWVNVAQTIYTYDSNNNKLTELQQNWLNESWEDSSSYTNTYDSNNNLLTKSFQRWANNSLSSSLITYYTYNSNNILQSELRQSLDSNVWKDLSLITYTYDSNNNLLTYLYQIWDSDSNSWVNSELYTCTYDLNGNLLTKQDKMWGYYSLMEFLVTYTYDSNNNLLTALTQNLGDDNSWENSSLNTYTYDSNNNLLTKLAQKWENDLWENSNQYQWIYDENGNGLSAESWIWVNGSWQSSDNSIYSFVTLMLYYNNMQSVFDGYCDKMTASYMKVGGSYTGTKDATTAPHVQIYSSGKTIHVNNLTGKSGMITVYGIDGVKVAEQAMAGQTTTLEMPVNGIYLVSVKAGNEKAVTAKLMLYFPR
ncbi:MAG: T9SS type A sorting domain-containing protein [Candidatus Azobacteroides sp.]|nr:T9SS type A sorting domain-containing protein [Candidatus Azobacteroides sp.]